MELLWFAGGLVALVAYLVYIAYPHTGPPRTPKAPTRPPPAPHRPTPTVAPAEPRPRSQPQTAPAPMPPSVRTEPVLACLAYLRHELGADWSGVLEPFEVKPKDAVDVNRAVNRLAEHVGVQGVRFIVAIGRLDPKHGGQIELERDRTEVFIDVSNRAAAFAPSLLGVLAHEVTHKALFDRRVLALDDDTRRYEILTDVTAVYLGFGKLLLNGYEYRSTRPGASTGAHESHHVRFGYLSVAEVAFVHAMACRMRGVEPQATLRGLSPFAARTAASVFGNPSIRAHIETAPQLVPRTTYVRHPEPKQPTATRPRSVAEPHAPRTSPPPARTQPASPPPAVPATFHLHERLLLLVYGDERLARRLVAFERERRQLSVEKSYEAAIERLIRDRS